MLWAEVRSVGTKVMERTVTEQEQELELVPKRMMKQAAVVVDCLITED